MYQLFFVLLIVESGSALQCRKCNADSVEVCDALNQITTCGRDENLCFTMTYEDKTIEGNKKTIQGGVERGCASKKLGCESYCEQHRLFNYNCKIKCCSSNLCNEKKRVYQDKNKRASSTVTNDGLSLRKDHSTSVISLLLLAYILLRR